MNELDIYTHIHLLKIKRFRGIFMRDTLPSHPRKIECAIINLDSINGNGTHWVTYYKYLNDIYYFDSYGNLPPPIEVIMYFGNDKNIYYNTYIYQKFGTTICGQLCIMFLYHMNKKMHIE